MAFQAPKTGDKIELANKPGEYYLVDSVEKGRDRSGQEFWQAMARDKEGRKQRLNSDNVQVWKHWKGPEYQWYKDEAEKAGWKKTQDEQKSLVSLFEQKYKFPDGTPLKTDPEHKTLVRVVPGAIGDLGAFEGNNLLLAAINYANETVSLIPAESGYEDLVPLMSAIPASEVVRGTKPAMSKPDGIVELPNGTQVTAGDLVSMTPALNALARNGQVEIVARVEPLFKRKIGGKETNGEEIFIMDMIAIGLRPESIQKVTKYYVSPRSGQAPYGPWSGDLRISGGLSDAARGEIAMVAYPGLTEWGKKGGVRIQSNDLYRQMIILGVKGSRPAWGAGAEPETEGGSMSPAVAWVKNQCLFSKS